MRSVTKIVNSRIGINASIRGSAVAENGTAIPKAASKTAKTAIANRRCPDVGGKVANENSGSSDASRTANLAPRL